MSGARWRSAPAGAPPPKLLVIGRRGWENENVVDLLERCEILRGPVQELGSPPDRQVAALLAGARAVLYPSFVEGYGLPVAESLGLGVPVICSDVASLREVGGGVPEYLDPLDGPAWRRMIEAYAAPRSPAREAQCNASATGPRRAGAIISPRWMPCWTRSSAPPARPPSAFPCRLPGTARARGADPGMSRAPEPKPRRRPDCAIAILGAACRLPGAADLDAFWSLLAEGRDAVSTLPADRFTQDLFAHPRHAEPGKS